MAGFEVTPEAQALTVTSSISISIVFSVHSVHQLLESHNYGRFCVRRRSIIKVDENDEKIALRRMVAGRGILRNHGRNNNSPETGRWRERKKALAVLGCLRGIRTVVIARAVPFTRLLAG